MLHNLILDAASKYEIYFLLTSYLESVRYCDKLGVLPKELTRLPCAGIDDIWERLEALNTELDGPPPLGSLEPRDAALREAAATLDASIRRLRELAEEPADSMHQARFSKETHTA